MEPSGDSVPTTPTGLVVSDEHAIALLNIEVRTLREERDALVERYRDLREWAELVARHGTTVLPMERYTVLPIEQVDGLRRALRSLDEK